MKFYKITYLIIVMVFLIVSCENELDQDPITEKNATSFFSNEIEIESAVNGVYAQLQAEGLYGTDLIGVGEVSGDTTFEEVPNNDDGRFGQLDSFTTSAGNELIAFVWKDSYVAIQRANLVLNRITDITFEDNNIKNHRIGEVSFIRALLYFNLVRLYGDVPLVTEETTNPSDFLGQGRTVKAEVYAQIESDLLSAISQLPETNTSGRPGRGAAQALLGNVYLTLGQYSSSLSQFQSVVNSGIYQLVPDVNAIFGIANEGNSETLFSVQFTSGLDGNSEGSSAFSQFSPAGTVAIAKGHNLPILEFYNSYDNADLRKTAYLNITNTGQPFTNKFEANPTNSNDGGSDFIVIRYSDVILMLAEALNETDGVGAIQLLNSIRNRAGLSNTTAVTKTEIRDAIEQERKFELISEGIRWFDLLRTNKAIVTMNTWFFDNGINISIDEHHLLLPVPQNQIDTDPAIVQNPGY